jgi:hypothetical protein
MVGLLAQMLESNNLRSITDADIKHTLKRVKSFGAERRIYFGFGYMVKCEALESGGGSS